MYLSKWNALQCLIRRSIFVAVLCVATVFAVGGASAGDLVAKRDAYLDAWNSHDPAKAASFLTDDVVYYDASAGAPQTGREKAQKNIIESFMTAAPNSKWETVGDPIATGNSLAFEWKFTGTNTGNWADGTAATGKPFEFRGMSILKFTPEEKISYQGDYYDALSLFKQLGLL